MTDTKKPVQCCRCRNKHDENERDEIRNYSYKDMQVYDRVCPRCSAKSYFLLDENGKIKKEL